MMRLPLLQQSSRSARAVRRLLAAALAASLAGGFSRGTETVAELTELLRERGVPFDSEAAIRGALDGLIKAVDPMARILTREQAASLDLTLPAPARGIATEADVATVSAGIGIDERADGLIRVRLPGLYRGTGLALAKRLVLLARQAGINGVLLDLRGAGGADLESVDLIAAMFGAGEDVLYRVVSAAAGDSADHRSPPQRALGLPAVLLVDRGTSDAAETLAAVLRGCRGILLLGEPTRGDARIRELIPLQDGRYLYIASRRVTLPRGASYDGTGVEPEVLVESPSGHSAARGGDSAAQAATNAPAADTAAPDPAMARASDILLGLKALGIHASRTAHDPAR